jgi:DNA-binding response OmpR family regulator
MSTPQYGRLQSHRHLRLDDEVDPHRGRRRTYRALFAEVFASHDWRVTRYSDGQRAGEALGGSAHYDTVLVGYRFEDMDGVELITRIRRLDHRQDVAIVMVTGTVDCAVVGAALSAGADDVLYKPTDVAIVVTTVTKCVERRGRQDT